MKKIIMILLWGIMIFPVVSADIIIPGTHPIRINNQINNLQDYPNYVFIVVSKGPVSDLLVEGEINYVKEDGTIETPYYKFSQISVYAIKKSNFNEEEIKNLEEKDNYKESLEEYFDSINAKEVIKNIEHYNVVSDASTINEENNYYTISLDITNEVPDNKDIERNYLVYAYNLLLFH